MKKIVKLSSSARKGGESGGGGPPKLESTWLRLNYRLISTETVRVKHPDVVFALARQAAYIVT